MFPIPDTLAAFYLFCFAVGFLFTFASLFLGLTHDALHLPGLPGGDSGSGAGIDSGAEAGAAGDAGLPDPGPDGASAAHHTSHHHGHGMSPINVSTIMAFFTWFGGAGYVLRAYVGILGFLSVAFASLVGLLGGAIVFYLLVRVLLPGQRIMDPSDYEIIGTIARVTVPIERDRAGEIVYSKGGSRRSDGARSVDGSSIVRGTEVVVVRHERGMAYVEPWSSYVARG